MFNKYFQQELQNLRELGKEFSTINPAIAPFLSGQSADPDVERLLEGVAFLTGLLHQKIDDELPEIIHGLTDIVFPHYLKPVPAMSIVAFEPKPNLMETIEVKAGTSLATKPVDGTKCLFKTCYDVEVHPLRIVSVESVEQSGKPTIIRFSFELINLDLSQWQPRRLSFFLGGAFPQATDLFVLLTRYVKRISMSALDGGNMCVLPPQSLKPVGFDSQSNLLPFPPQSFSGYQLLQEYFALPQKTLYLELHGWDQWKDRGAGVRFNIDFELMPSPIPMPALKSEHVHLSSTPAVNLFPHEADPIPLDHRQAKVRVRPSGQHSGHYQVYSVDNVIGYTKGSLTQKDYIPLNQFSLQGKKDGCYQIIHSLSPLNNKPEVSLAFAYSPENLDLIEETLSINLTCTNGTLPEQLQLGDISQQTSDSSGLLSFKNITPVTSPIDPPLKGDMLWKLLSHLSLNFLSLADVDALKTLLNLYLFSEGRDRSKVSANIKRVDGIIDYAVKPTDLLVKGVMMRGQEIMMTVRQDHFASMGDLIIFGSVMDEFFGEYSSFNTFTHFKMKDSLSGEIFEWPPRVGDKPLI